MRDVVNLLEKFFSETGYEAAWRKRVVAKKR